MESKGLKKLSSEDLVEEFDCALSRLIHYANSPSVVKDTTMIKAETRYNNAKEELLRRLNGEKKIWISNGWVYW